MPEIRGNKISEERGQIEAKLHALENQYEMIRYTDSEKAERVKAEIEQLRKELKENKEGIYHNSEGFYGMNKVEQAMAAVNFERLEDDYIERLSQRASELEKEISSKYDDYYNSPDLNAPRAQRYKLEAEALRDELVNIKEQLASKGIYDSSPKAR